MARRVILSDDLSGNESEDVKTHVYMVDNVFYEVDFSDESFDKFEKALGRFIKVSRETRRITATAKGEATDAEKIRQWAKAAGMDVGEKGRLSADVIKAYHDAVNGISQNTANPDNSDTDGADAANEESGSNSDPAAQTS